MSEIAVLGAGAFGTALAICLAQSGHSVTLWCRSEAQAETLETRRENPTRLPGVSLPEGVRATSDLGAVRSETVLIALPAQQIRGFFAAHSPAFAGCELVSCAKGVDRSTFQRPSEVIAAACPGARVAVLTGPGFAADIARGLPTALTLAAEWDAHDLQRRLSGATLRLYLTHDVAGAELGGALKNVIALAAGLTMGAGLGESARAAVITRGFAEMIRFAQSRGAKAETLAGLSGLGDLVLTCTSEKSRNYAAGLAIGRGDQPDPERTIEGLATAEAVSNLGEIEGIELPLTSMVAAVATGRLTVADAAQTLMSRPLRKE